MGQKPFDTVDSLNVGVSAALLIQKIKEQIK
jgi:tRNA G18 (ribose-2'-O)-methylase SpoU